MHVFEIHIPPPLLPRTGTFCAQPRCAVLFRVEDVYEMGHELGKGAFSVVRHGRHRQTGENVSSARGTAGLSTFFFFQVLRRMGKSKLELPHFHVSDTCVSI